MLSWGGIGPCDLVKDGLMERCSRALFVEVYELDLCPGVFTAFEWEDGFKLLVGVFGVCWECDEACRNHSVG